MTETAVDYTTIKWTQLQKLAKERGIKGRFSRDALVRKFQEQDGTAEPETVGTVNVAGRRSQVTRVYSEQHTRDATRIVDQDGNAVAMVFRLGRQIGDDRVVLDMDANVNRIIGAFGGT